jgi:CHASE2 domain-containing sensor protein
VKTAGFWKKDWFLGLAVAIVLFLVAVPGGSRLIQSLERAAYDMGVRATDRTPSDRIAIIAIDEPSVQNLGRWPWPRDVHARLTDVLAAGKPRVIANLVIFSEPELDRGLAYVNKLAAEYQKAVPDPNAVEQGSPLATIGQLLAEAEGTLNTDRQLAASYQKAANVVLPMLFEIVDPRGKPDKPLPDYVVRNALGAVEGDRTMLPLATSERVLVPIAPLGAASAGIGHLNLLKDVDGAIRVEALVLTHFDRFYPSAAMLIAAKSLNLGVDDIKVDLGRGVSLTNLRIKSDPQLLMHTYFYKDRDGRQAFPIDSFFDVFSGKIPAEKYRDKVVLIGPTAAALGESPPTPIAAATPGVVTLANAVSSILQEHFFVVPSWAGWVEFGLYVLVALYLVVALPRLGAGMAAAATGLLLAALIGAHFGLMTARGIWLQLMLPAVLLVLGHVLLTTKRFLVTERGKERSEAESATSNRMLGLAYQGQGQLDMALDYFRKCPVDDTVLDNLYNLALDFERKRQFNKAESVFRYMAEHNPKFRDLGERLSRAKQLSETVIFGSGGPKGHTQILTGGEVEKPMLGRYQVEKELGKGAMGVVYQGKDPKIGRVVAIKTMALAQEFEAEELADVKARFFREAETAGRLNHPNIVTIFDAGEEHDLAYIAMEFLKGRDLVPYTKPGALLPVEKAVSIAARVADALGYAHRQNVVHRDVKPANVMYEPESDTVKVTDFGIARITDSSKTKTGMVLGTPSYMSPEQLAGKRIDGRSDLFSLAVSLYQLLCGRLPFDGESMAQLMFKIANEPAPDILQFNPGLPPALVTFLDRAMAKEADARFQTGDEFAQALRACMGAQKPQVDITI